LQYDPGSVVGFGDDPFGTVATETDRLRRCETVRNGVQFCSTLCGGFAHRSTTCRQMATRHPPFDPDSRDAGELLANRRRRHALTYLRDRPRERVSVEELTSQVIARELVEGDGTVDPESVRATLLHVHLPKLAEAGLVDYDAETSVAYLPPRDGTVAADGDVVLFEGGSA
jgi:DNA-binding transcriptional ArsR family regulator